MSGFPRPSEGLGEGRNEVVVTVVLPTTPVDDGSPVPGLSFDVVVSVTIHNKSERDSRFGQGRVPTCEGKSPCPYSG